MRNNKRLQLSEEDRKALDNLHSLFTKIGELSREIRHDIRFTKERKLEVDEMLKKAFALFERNCHERGVHPAFYK